jgi:hypothetical protein
MEPGRRPIARGKHEDTEAAVYDSSPQLSRLLRSEFVALVVGHQDDNDIRQYLPPHPARIHGFVYLCQPEDIRNFARSFDFITILINAGESVPTGELISAALRNMSAAVEDSRAFLVAAGKELAMLLSSHYDQLKSILTRITPR